MKLDYEGLAVLTAVVRTGSFDGAADLLGVTQSAVSQRIKHMEERIGVSLIVRGRPSKATDEGLLLCQHFDYLTLLEKELFSRLSGASVGTQETITVRIYVNNDSLATWFPSVIRELTQKTRIRLEIAADDQAFTEERLRSGDALAVVTSCDTPMPGSRSICLGLMEYMAVCTPDFYLNNYSQGVDLASLRKSSCIIFDRKDSLPATWVRLSFSEVPDLDAHFVPSFEGHLSCCVKGVGWAMMPTMTVQPYIEQGRLREVLPGKRVDVPLFWQMRNQSSEILKTLTEFVEAEAARELRFIKSESQR